MDDKLVLILRGAGGLFRKYGIRNISMDDLCREVGISKKTLYQYVSSKADLIEKLLGYYLTENQCPACEETELKNAIDALLEVSMHISQFMSGFKPSAVFELQKYYPELFRKFVEQKREDTYKGIIKNMEAGIRQGLYRQDLEIELIARLYVQKLEDLHDYDYLSSLGFDFSRIFLVMFENHIRGIANTQGIEYFEKKKKSLNLTI